MDNTPSDPRLDAPSHDAEPHEEQELLPEHATPDAPAKPAYSAPITAILQWLTYAFWGWTAMALAALVGVIAHYSLNGYGADYASVAYVIGTTLVLLPIAVICDVLFSKREEDHKHGFQMVIMVIHAVLFALLAVAALATVVYSLISIVLSDTGDAKGPLVFTITAAVLLVFLSGLFVRIIRPAVNTKLRLIARIALSIIVLGAIVWGIVGPVTQTIVRKADQRAANAIEVLDQLVQNQAMANNKLPDSIDAAIEGNDIYYYQKDALDALRAAAASGSVTYTPNTKEPTVKTQGLLTTSTTTTHYYELCVTYQFDDETRQNSRPYIIVEDDGYLDGLTGTSKEAGKHCYDLKATVTDRDEASRLFKDE